jgi:hypothetical protein
MPGSATSARGAAATTRRSTGTACHSIPLAVASVLQLPQGGGLHVRDALLYLIGRSRYREAPQRSARSLGRLYWLLDVQFKDDLSCYRSGNSAKNMAFVRRFALGLVRAKKVQAQRKDTKKISKLGHRLLARTVTKKTSA